MHKLIRNVSFVLPLLFVVFIILSNVFLTKTETIMVSNFMPADRFSNGNVVKNYVYFSVYVPSGTDVITMRIHFKDKNQTQFFVGGQLSAGFNYSFLPFYDIVLQKYFTERTALNQNIPELTSDLSGLNNVTVASSKTGSSSFRQIQNQPSSRYKLVPIPQTFDQLLKVDYLYTDYLPAVQDGDWLVGNAQFSVNELYVENGKATFLLNMPHLDRLLTSNVSIPIDFIEVNLTSKGLLEND